MSFACCIAWAYNIKIGEPSELIESFDGSRSGKERGDILFSTVAGGGKERGDIVCFILIDIK